MDDNIDYLKFVTKHIEKDKLLSTIDPIYHGKILKLLEKKEEIRNKNGIFAVNRIEKINQKLEKFKSKTIKLQKKRNLKLDKNSKK